MRRNRETEAVTLMHRAQLGLVGIMRLSGGGNVAMLVERRHLDKVAQKNKHLVDVPGFRTLTDRQCSIHMDN